MIDQSLLAEIDKWGFIGIVSFGLTYLLTIIIKKYRDGYELTSIQKSIVQGLFVLVLIYVPLPVQYEFVRALKIAIGVVATTATGWQVVKAFKI